MNNIIQTSNLCKSYGKAQALDTVTIGVTEGSITGLVGRNGSGKTTLLKILAGRLDKTSGSVQVFEANPMDNIFVQNCLIYTCHNVLYDQSIKLGTILYIYKEMYRNFDFDFADGLMKYFELKQNMKYKSLSQGMAGIFNFLCAIACRAELTMFDEPVLGMDVTVRKSAYEILLRDASEHPRTFIISSHLLSEIEGVLSDILLIEKGSVVLHSSIDDIRNSAYRIDGSAATLDAFTSGKKIIAKKTSALTNFAVIYEPLTEDVTRSAAKANLDISPVRAEDLCVYLTRQGKEDELECLWQK